VDETIDQYNERLKAEFSQRPDAAEKTREFNFRYGTAEITPADLSKPADTEQLSPELAKLKADYERTHPQDASPQPGQQPSAAQPAVTFGPAWDYTPEQAQEALRQEQPYWWVDTMSTVQDPQSFADVFGTFIKTEADKAFLAELFQLVGNHPGVLRLYAHLAKLVRGSKT